ncbi:MAG: hypothetical protein ABWZ25_10840 [Chitinophagaceae bacterium]
MKKWYLFPALFLLLVLINACQKEFSRENGDIEAEGTLQSDVTGDCLPKTVAGSFEATVALDDSNYIDVSVNVTAPGIYTITTDTINGFYFSATGRFTSTGLTTVRLNGSGTPIADGTDIFVVSFGGSTCAIAVVTVPEGAGGPAVFTLTGAPGDCTTPNIEGVYSTGIQLNAATHYIEVKVNVTTIGTYNITTNTANGITFSGTGTFGSTGDAIVTLAGSGEPLASGVTELAVEGVQACAFTVNVIGEAEYAIDCQSKFINGYYEVGVELDGTHTVEVGINVGTPGAYSITGTLNGMTFSSVGEFMDAGFHPVVLQGSGTPTTEDYNFIELSGGSEECILDIFVNPGVVKDWEFTEAANYYSGGFDVASVITQTGAPTILVYGGSSGSDVISIGLSDASGGAFEVNETYDTRTSNPALNSAAFIFEGPANSYYADPTIASVSLVFTITEHDPSTQMIKGTYTGTVKHISGQNRNITLGMFSGTYQQ